ncbi:Acetyltransferase (GNAT) domain-containing protein [Halobacillus dabanensis]|uniref:Acetyltransferase (GNAT) domain-containing protein n=1 Tax=Halobacillus dabanensis TaxID=240302 RepID=A0A1I3XF47_HALDA|nr:GNAT family N-acetyltransferase [Halobacillus dabanensis]SFK17711.1 Acetyltransferase (GNAT) domain-containing protein [Halobacillus dabanensis]
MTVRPYKPGDEVQIQLLFKKTFGNDRPLKTWTWKFKENPKQDSPFILVYEDNNKILGHISLWITEAYINGNVTKIGLRADTMVDPQARGKGIYKKLNDTLLEKAKLEGIDYLYGFPAPKAKELFQKYTGAHHMTDMPRWLSVRHPMALLSSKFSPLRILKPLDKMYANFKKVKVKDHPYVFREVTECDHNFDELASETKFNSKAMVVRDAAYLNWRYHNHPEKTYRMFGLYDGDKLKGYVVTNKVEGSFTNGFIVDWLTSDAELWPILLDYAMQDLYEADIIQTWCLTHSGPVHSLKKAGFIHKDSPMPLVGKEINSEWVELKDPQKWFITPGDVDSF